MPRRQEIPIESSWRMVEGEHDSFDTSLVPSLGDEADYDIPLSTGPSQLSQGSQGQVSLGSHSQDSIGGFIARADDEQVILHSPFRPSIPGAVSAHQQQQQQQRGQRGSPRDGGGYCSPEPEFHMPRVDLAPGALATGSRRSSGRSSRTIRPGMMVDEDSEGMQALRRRVNRAWSAAENGSPSGRKGYAGQGRMATGRRGGRRAAAAYDDEYDLPRTFAEKVADSLPDAVFNVLSWMLGVVGLAFRFAQKPLALLLAAYLFFGGAIMVQNMITKSIFVSLSPLCRIPGTSLLHLPFCPDPLNAMPNSGFNGSTGTGSSASAASTDRVEFDDLMSVQAQFERVLERSADGVSLPLEMKRSESSIRDLRTMVRYSELSARDELVLEFDGYIEVARAAASDLQRFNTHVGSAVDSVISINRWTSRFLDSMAAASSDIYDPFSTPGAGDDRGSDPVEDSTHLLADWAAWFFAPFLPATSPGAFDERALLDKYVEHTALVSDRIAALIVEAQAVLRLLSKAEDHLSLIYDVVARSQQAILRDRRASTGSSVGDVLQALWNLVGAGRRRLHNAADQLALLRRVDVQRSDAVAQVSALIVELEKIQAGLGDLRDRVAAPELLRDAEGLHSGRAIPLVVHIETINRGVERLEDARQRIRAAENDRIREALARGGVDLDEKLIEGR